MGFFEKQKKRKLYQQWIEKSGLPPESIPRELEPENAGDVDLRIEDDLNAPETRRRRALDIRLTVRDLLIMVLIIVVLLVLSSTLATILVMRSC
jgi:hypothetical protein